MQSAGVPSDNHNAANCLFSLGIAKLYDYVCLLAQKYSSYTELRLQALLHGREPLGGWVCWTAG